MKIVAMDLAKSKTGDLHLLGSAPDIVTPLFTSRLWWSGDASNSMQYRGLSDNENHALQCGAAGPDLLYKPQRGRYHNI
jgi:hypothetical protein